MRFLGRTMKYLLRSVFSIIIFIMFVGWAKMDRHMGEYVGFLNTNDWSVFHWSQPASWCDPFWPDKQFSGDIADIFSGDAADAGTSGLDVYDPAFEQDFNATPDSSLSGADETFWFTADGQTSSDTTSKIQLLKMIKQRELAK